MVNVTMSINVALESTTADQAIPADEAPAATENRAASADDERAALLDQLLDELGGLGPRQRVGLFRSWHRGALSLVQLSVLAILEAEGPLPMNRLAEWLDVSDASATGIVDRIERRGFVERRHATDDRRLVLVHLTDAGRSVFQDIERHRRERVASLLDELADDELAGLLRGLRAMNAAAARLAAQDPAAPEPAPILPIESSPSRVNMTLS